MQDSAVPNLNTSNERSGSSEQGASERSEAAPERELAQESKALLQQRIRMRRKAEHGAKLIAVRPHARFD